MSDYPPLTIGWAQDLEERVEILEGIIRDYEFKLNEIFQENVSSHSTINQQLNNITNPEIEE